jgi:hypothetical protein
MIHCNISTIVNGNDLYVPGGLNGQIEKSPVREDWVYLSFMLFAHFLSC